MTSDNALSDASKPFIDSAKVPKIIPRHYMVVSRPVTHPAAPPRNGLVRGQYESVELIREIPVTRLRSSSSTDLQSMNPESPRGRRRSATIGFAESRGPSAKGEVRDRWGNASSLNPELNPVEWIMITRSDPGGGIPRFMVERGTPSSIVADAAKFLDWACGSDVLDEEDEQDAHAISDQISAVGGGDAARRSIDEKGRAATHRRPSNTQPLPPGEGGVISAFTHAVEAGLSNYAPEFVHDQFFGRRRRSSLSEESTATSSTTSFASAEQYKTAPEGLRHAGSSDGLSEETQKLHLEDEPELAHIQQKKDELDAKLAKFREKEMQKMKQLSEKDEKDSVKARERLDKEIRKQEERHNKEIHKLQQRREKETRKMEEKRRKAADKDAVHRAQRERDEARTHLDLMKKENAILKEQVGQLQRENTALVAKFGKTEEGQKALKLIRQDSAGLLKGHNRAASFRSESSMTSKKSGGSEKGSGNGPGSEYKNEQNRSRDRLQELTDEPSTKTSTDK